MTVASAALLLLGFIPAQGASAADCHYEPATHVLLVTANAGVRESIGGIEENVVLIRRARARITVSGSRGRGLNRLSCGGTPTVTNTDRIDIVARDIGTVMIDLRGGPFASGATPKPGSSSEIQFTARGTGEVDIFGANGADRFRYMELEGRSGLNLNAGDDRDLDLVITNPKVSGFVWAGAGADRVEVVGRPKVRVEVSGGGGNDTLIARRGGFGGSVLLGGGPGRDRIVGVPSSDWIDPGSGPDVVKAGGGADVIYMRPDKRRDRIDCGSGRDRVRRDLFQGRVADPFDRLRACESIEGRR